MSREVTERFADTQPVGGRLARLRQHPRRRSGHRWIPRSRKAQAGLLIVGFFIVLGVVGSHVAPYNPSATSAAILQPPSAQHLLGTTQEGQDVLSQLLASGWVTLLV